MNLKPKRCPDLDEQSHAFVSGPNDLVDPFMAGAPPLSFGTGLVNKVAELSPKELASRLVTRLYPTRNHPFGSRAEGRARADGDFDLLVVMPDDTSEERLAIDHAHEAERGLGMELGLLRPHFF
jgi:hypothetical protein